MYLPRTVRAILGLGLLFMLGQHASSPACTLTGATLQIAGDDGYSVYINGILIGSCQTPLGFTSQPCWGAVAGAPFTYTLTPAELAAVNPVGDNVLASSHIMTETHPEGQTWLLALQFSDCPTQYVMSGGYCTLYKYVGQNPANIPPGWTNVSFDDSTWIRNPFVGVVPVGYAWPAIPDPSGLGTVYWINGVTYDATSGNDGFLYREHFYLGSSGCVLDNPVSKSVNVATAAVGDTVTYTLVEQNSGSVTLTNVQLWDTLAPNVSYLASSQALLPASSAPLYGWNLGTVATGQSATVWVAVKVNSGLNGTVVHNTTSAFCDQTPPHLSNDAPFTILVPDANLQKSANVSTAAVGDTVTYTLAFTPLAPPPVATPQLDLQVQNNGCSANSLQYGFQISNVGSTAVDISKLSVVMWIYDGKNASQLLESSPGYGGVQQPGAAWSNPTFAFSASAYTPAVTFPSGRKANIQLSWKATTANMLAAGKQWTSWQVQANFSGYATFDSNNGPNNYSYTTASSYASDPHFALYYNGALLQEYTSGAAKDPNTGVPPGNWVVVGDSVPAGITYVGSSPLAAGTTRLTWENDLVQGGQVLDFTWWGVVQAAAPCTVITNRADYTSNTVAGLSNPVDISVACAQSPSPSPTFSSTRTFSATSTPTPTSTLKSSPSSTATATFTPTRTATATVTASASVTATRTDSPTPSATPSVTVSASVTNTRTATPSFSFTPTVTASASITHTSTVTPSFSATPTVTFSASITFTLTASPTPSDSASPTPTATASPTASASGTSTPSPSITVTATPSPSRTASPSVTATRSCTASYTVSPTFTPTFSISPTFTPPPASRGTLRIFNTAGELVAIAAENVGLQSPPRSLGALVGAFCPDLGGSAVLLVDGSGLTLLWDGRDAKGQAVSSGCYVAQLEVRDNFGRISTFQQNVTVLRAQQGVDVEIYDSSGEMVRQVASLRGPLDAPSLSLKEAAFVPGKGPGLEIDLGPSFGKVYWDGLNSRGQQVKSGDYVVKASSLDSGGQARVFSQIVSVTCAARELLQGAMAGPSPAGPQDQRVVVYPSGLGNPVAGLQASGTVYNLAGEAVAILEQESTGNLVWSLQDRASGVYIIRLQARASDGTSAFRLLKVAIAK